ncbi:hypothetical protein Leryth_006587 [Lithospermum erythrorhizon]|nr:hypothetical protein Leryth_006587 [Lithospermum erythrorhizon]
MHKTFLNSEQSDFKTKVAKQRGIFCVYTQLQNMGLALTALTGIIIRNSHHWSHDELEQESLKNINLSFNMIEGELNSTGFYSLEVLDLSFNRIHGDMQFVMSGICNSLVVANFSSNYLTGQFSSTLINL